MAEAIEIKGSSYQGKVRNPLGVIGLSLITLGIYHLVWYFKINKELAEIGQARGTEECGTNPTTSLLALFPGAFILVPPFVSYYNFTKRLSAGERVTGTPAGMEPGLLFLLYVGGIFVFPLIWVAQYITQSNLNKVLQSQGGGAGQLAGQPDQVPVPESAPEQPTR
jgi:hypothetical protein